MGSSKKGHRTPIRRLIDKHIIDWDNWVHHLPGPAWTLLCGPMDITLGYEPTSKDIRFDRWFFRWYWNGDCNHCCGRGRFKWMDVRQTDGSYKRHHEVLCEGCKGTGRQ